MDTKKLHITPAGYVGYSHLNKPNKFGSYQIELILEGEEAEALKAKVTALSQEGKDELIAAEKDKKKIAELKKLNFFLPFEAETNDDGEETGRTVFLFKNKAEGKGRDGKPFKRGPIETVDAKRQPMKNPKVGRGSKVKVAFTVAPFTGFGLIGATFRLQSVQVLEYKPFSSGASAAFSEEEGYVYTDAGETDTAAGAVDAGTGNNSDY